MNQKLKIAMLGTGYVGLVSGTCFSSLGFEVTCIDNDEHKIDSLQRNEIPIFEPNLKELVQENKALNRLHFTSNKKDIQNADVIFIAVGTPPCPKTSRADLQYIESAARELAPLLIGHKTIVIKSTVPVGTCQKVKSIIETMNPKAQFDLVSNPEFLREGSAVFDFMNPDRIIIGVQNERARKTMETIYASFVEKGVPLISSDLETSEMIKYAANCFLATKLAFVNEVSSLCEKLGADIEKVMKGVGSDPRIGSLYLQAGPGFGGSCFPKDTLAFRDMAREVESPLEIIDAVITSNEKRKKEMVEKIVKVTGGVSGKTIAILGVAFKANTDDVRDSASLTIIQELQKQGAKIAAFDPKAMEKAAKILKDVRWAKDSYDAIRDAHVVVIVTEWEEFRKLELQRVRELLKQKTDRPLMIDLRNLYDPEKVASFGLSYASIGRVLKEALPLPQKAEA